MFQLAKCFFFFCYKKYIYFEKSDRFPVETRADPRLYPYGRLSLFNYLNRLLFEDEKYSICAKCVLKSPFPNALSISKPLFKLEAVNY